jgi:mRNA interferase RelE/StbE
MSLGYRVETANSNVEKQILRLQPAERNRVAERILRLEDEPRPLGAVKLKDNIYRIRVGRMRVVYEINDKEGLIVVTKVARRRETTYKRI